MLPPGLCNHVQRVPWVGRQQDQEHNCHQVPMEHGQQVSEQHFHQGLFAELVPFDGFKHLVCAVLVKV